MRSAIRICVVLIATVAAASIGLLFMDANVSAWYDALVKPGFMPPGWVFGIVWIVLYTLMALSCGIVWLMEPQTEHTEGWVRFYFVQLLFNAGWTMFFFGFHAILLGFVDMLFLGFVVLGLFVTACEIDRRVSYLLAPYLLWIVFAAYLNLQIWILN